MNGAVPPTAHDEVAGRRPAAGRGAEVTHSEGVHVKKGLAGGSGRRRPQLGHLAPPNRRSQGPYPTPRLQSRTIPPSRLPRRLSCRRRGQFLGARQPSSRQRRPLLRQRGRPRRRRLSPQQSQRGQRLRCRGPGRKFDNGSWRRRPTRSLASFKRPIRILYL